MFSMRYAENKDWPFWQSLDKHLPITVFKRKTAVQECMSLSGKKKQPAFCGITFSGMNTRFKFDLPESGISQHGNRKTGASVLGG